MNHWMSIIFNCLIADLYSKKIKLIYSKALILINNYLK